jgi:cytochrome P450
MTIAVHYDPLAAETLRNPYPLYAHLRETAPVFWHERMECWVLTRYRDCQEVLRNNDVFASDWRRVGEDTPEPLLGLQALDPPDHTPLRSLFTNALHQQDLDAIAARGKALAGRLLAGVADRPRTDLIADLVAPVALATVSDLVGIEPPDLAAFDPISDAIVRSMDAGLDPSARAPGVAARARLNELVESWFAADPRPGMLADVAHLRESVEIPDHFVRNTARIVFQSGYSSMVAGAGNALLALLENPGSLAALRDPALRGSGFDELMRYDSSVQGTSRAAVATTVIGGVTVERGQVVLMLFGAANRDPEKFPDPDRLLLDRSPNQHMSFGRGPHACVGNLFTRAILQMLIDALLEHPEPRLVEPPVRKPTATVRYLATLPVSFSRKG